MSLLHMIILGTYIALGDSAKLMYLLFTFSDNGEYGIY